MASFDGLFRARVDDTQNAFWMSGAETVVPRACG